MKEKAPPGLAKDTALFAKVPVDKQRLIEAYGLGLLHGALGCETDKPEEKESA